MTKLKCWKPSQRSSGYYSKLKGELPIFIRFYRHENGQYDVDKRVGLNADFTTIGKKSNKTQALKFAKSYMKKHDKC